MELVMKGGDVDINVCFVGVLFGVYLGFVVLLDYWRNGMVYGKWLVGKVEFLC